MNIQANYLVSPDQRLEQRRMLATVPGSALPGILDEHVARLIESPLPSDPSLELFLREYAAEQAESIRPLLEDFRYIRKRSLLKESFGRNSQKDKHWTSSLGPEKEVPTIKKLPLTKQEPLIRFVAACVLADIAAGDGYEDEGVAVWKRNHS